MLRIMVTPRMPSGAGHLRLQDRARPHDHLVDRPLDAGVEDRLRAVAEQVGAEHHRRHRRAHQEVDGSRHLVVAGAGVERDALGRHLQAVAQLDGAVALAVAVDGVGEGVHALGHERAQLLAQLGARSRRSARSKAPIVTPRPKRWNSSARRRSPSRIAAMEARVSPLTISGKRELRKNMRSSSSATTPSRTTRTGGTMMPSWKMSVQSGDSEPGRMPPISLKCAQRLREGRELAVGEHGRQEHLVGRVGDGALRGVAVVEPVDVAGAHGVERVVLGDRARPRRRRRAGSSRRSGGPGRRTGPHRSPSSRE